MSTTPVKVWTKLLGTSSGHSYSRTTDQDDSIYVGVWAIGALRIEVAGLPSGKHKLQLSAEDSLRRKGNPMVDFQIN